MLTDKEVGTYVVYRLKLNELMHLHYLFHAVRDGQCGESIFTVQKDQLVGSLQIAAMAWFATMLDTNGLDIFKLWTKMYPQYKKRIAFFRARLSPNLDILRRFRNRTAFHAEPEFKRFFEPRLRLLEKAKNVSESLQEFLKLASFLLKREQQAEPNLPSRILDVIFDAELELKCSISRSKLISANILDRSVFKKTVFR